MSGHPEPEALEAAAGGQGAPELEAHAAQCAQCARELAWLRAERALLARRPAPRVDHLWPGVQARLGKSSALASGAARDRLRRPHWQWRVAVAGAAAAALAAMLLIAIRARPLGPAAAPPRVAQREAEYRPDPRALAALDRAEADYRDAAKVLEAEYDRLRPRLDPGLARRWDETLTRARAQLGEASAVAAEDVNARMQVLDGYAGYLRSLRDVVQHSEEANQ